MGKSHPSTTMTALLCVEISVGTHKEDPPVQVVLSIPGREGTLRRSWGEPGKALDEAGSRDLSAWLNLTVRQLILSRHGIQQLLATEA